MNFKFDPLFIPAISTAITAAIAVFAVWLTSRLAIQRTHDDRIWIRKADAYSAISQSIKVMERVYIDWEAEATGSKEFSSDIEKEQIAQNTLAMQQLFSTVAANAWLLSEEVEQRCNKMISVLNVRHESWFEHVMDCAYELSKAHKDVLAIAKKELGRPRLIH